MEQQEPVSRLFGVEMLRITVILGALLIGAGFVFRYPGSLPAGWKQVDGTVSSVVGKQVGGRQLYYAVVQYQAVGYSYELTDPHGNSTAPDVGTVERVAFNPEDSRQAKLLSTIPANYFRLAFPAAGLLVIAAGAYTYTIANRPVRQAVAAEVVAIQEAPAPKAKAAKPNRKPKAKKQPTEPVVKEKPAPKKKRTVKLRKAKPSKRPNPKKQAIMLSRLKYDQ